MLRQQDSSVGILPVRTDQRATLAVLEKRSGRICSRSGGILQGNCKGRWLRWTEDGEVGDEILDQDRDSGKGHEKHGENQRSGRVHFRAFVATDKSQYEAGEAQACAEAAHDVDLLRKVHARVVGPSPRVLLADELLHLAVGVAHLF